MGTFLCPECGKNFSVDADLYLHQVRAHDTNSYTCENCGETVIGKKTLDNHMRKHNTAVTRLKRTHKCEECPYETKDKANLSKHTKRKLTGTMECSMDSAALLTRLQLARFECDICKATLAPTSLRCHKRTLHSDSSGTQWTCKSCNKVLQTRARLIQHENAHNLRPKENEFSCNECQYFTNNKNYLVDHQRKMHKIQGQGLWMCIMGKCKNKPKSFVNNQLLAKHAKIRDSNPCTKCQKTFGAKRNLVRHLRTVHKETEADDQKEHFGKFKQLTN